MRNTCNKTILFCFATGIWTLRFHEMYFQICLPFLSLSFLFPQKMRTLKFKCCTFFKNRQFWELFQKRFTTGSCDFRGVDTMYSLAPYIYNFMKTRVLSPHAVGATTQPCRQPDLHWNLWQAHKESNSHWNRLLEESQCKVWIRFLLVAVVKLCRVVKRAVGAIRNPADNLTYTETSGKLTRRVSEIWACWGRNPVSRVGVR